jgi:hypothetical protein
MELSDAVEKAPATQGIDPRTFRIVAQCLNHYTTPGPSRFCNVWVCVCVGTVLCGCVYVWVCVCVGFVMCGCVYVWVFW